MSFKLWMFFLWSSTVFSQDTSRPVLHKTYKLIKLSTVSWSAPHHYQADRACQQHSMRLAQVPYNEGQGIIEQLSEEDQSKLNNTRVWIKGRCDYQDLSGMKLKSMTPHRKFFNLKPGSKIDHCLALDCYHKRYCTITNHDCRSKYPYICPESLALKGADQCPKRMKEHQVRFKTNYRSCYSYESYEWEKIEGDNVCENWNTSLKATVDHVNRILYNAKGYFWIDGHYSCDLPDKTPTRAYSLSGDCAALQVRNWKENSKWVAHSYVGCETVGSYALCYKKSILLSSTETTKSANANSSSRLVNPTITPSKLTGNNTSDVGDEDTIGIYTISAAAYIGIAVAIVVVFVVAAVAVIVVFKRCYGNMQGHHVINYSNPVYHSRQTMDRLINNNIQTINNTSFQMSELYTPGTIPDDLSTTPSDTYSHIRRVGTAATVVYDILPAAISIPDLNDAVHYENVGVSLCSPDDPLYSVPRSNPVPQLPNHVEMIDKALDQPCS